MSGFQAHVEINLRTTDFEKFHRTALRGLYERLSGEAAFETMEQCLTVRLTGNEGHFTARCEVRDAPEVGGRLNFTLDFDRTFVPAMLAQLDAILEAFPVVGSA